MAIRINKDKSIGKVLYIVEGNKTEPYLIWRIFTKIFDYQVERIVRDHPYHKFNSKVNPHSQVFVINTQSSNIKTISKDNEFLDNIFSVLINDYDFDFNNAAIYYVFDRDCHSNTDEHFISEIIQVLKNARDNDGYDMQGMLLLSYPSIESFTLSNFELNSFEKKFNLGNDLKAYLEKKKINHAKINECTLKAATAEMLSAFDKIGIDQFDIDDFSQINKDIFDYEENIYSTDNVYKALSLFCISLIDLGLIETGEI